MTLADRLVVIFAKIIMLVIRRTGLGAGATWPGELALLLRPALALPLLQCLTDGVILIAGTYGKTTTSLMLRTILENAGTRIAHNESGANLVNGIVSGLVENASWLGVVRTRWGVFEVDENSLPTVLSSINNYQLTMNNEKNPKRKLIIILLNLFRDQLDRYGEVDVIAEKWERALVRLPKSAEVIANADDPLVAYLSTKTDATVRYFGLEERSLLRRQFEHATDSTFCLSCGNRLDYTQGIYYSHIGIWKCPNCGRHRPKLHLSHFPSPLAGIYNKYNTLAAVLTARALGVAESKVREALREFIPAFGRQEEFTYRGKRVKIYLSKNPAGFNASLRTVLEEKPNVLMLALNDRIPDGRDVSWIWDVDFETIPRSTRIIVSGDRVFDLALRIKYARDGENKLIIESDIGKAISRALFHTEKGKQLYVLPTYSAMLEIRKTLIGRKIL